MCAPLKYELYTTTDFAIHNIYNTSATLWETWALPKDKVGWKAFPIVIIIYSYDRNAKFGAVLSVLATGFHWNFAVFRRWITATNSCIRGQSLEQVAWLSTSYFKPKFLSHLLARYCSMTIECPNSGSYTVSSGSVIYIEVDCTTSAVENEVFVVVIWMFVKY